MSNEKTETTELDFDARYSVIGHGGVAWRLVGYKTERRPSIGIMEDEDGNEVEYECWEDTEEVEDRSQVVAIMVGDDHKWTFDVDDVREIGEDDYCHVCGQIGCGHDGRDRSESE
jgi:hypothetical protein